MFNVSDDFMIYLKQAYAEELKKTKLSKKYGK
jgi:hypothetical protein